MTVTNVYIFQCLVAIKDREHELVLNSDIHTYNTRISSNVHTG